MDKKEYHRLRMVEYRKKNRDKYNKYHLEWYHRNKKKDYPEDYSDLKDI